MSFKADLQQLMLNANQVWFRRYLLYVTGSIQSCCTPASPPCVQGLEEMSLPLLHPCILFLPLLCPGMHPCCTLSAARLHPQSAEEICNVAWGLPFLLLVEIYLL